MKHFAEQVGVCCLFILFAGLAVLWMGTFGRIGWFLLKAGWNVF